MPANFIGLKNVGAHHHRDPNKLDSPKQKVTAAWFVFASVGAGDPPVQQLVIPGTAGNTGGGGITITGWKFTLDPIAQQGAFNFAATKSVAIAALLQDAIVQGATLQHTFVPGRIFVYVESTGQLLILTAKTTILAATAALIVGTLGQAFENITLNTGSETAAKIDVFVEADVQDSVVQNINSHQLQIVLYNFDVAPVEGGA